MIEPLLSCDLAFLECRGKALINIFFIYGFSVFRIRFLFFNIFFNITWHNICMVLSTFSHYYFQSNEIIWKAWDATCRCRKISEAEEWEKIDIDEGAQKYAVPNSVQNQLDACITQETYQQLISIQYEEKVGKISVHKSLIDKGFCFLKDSSGSRVVYHQSCPEWIIKIGLKKARKLPLGGPVKVKKNDPEVWHPLLNLNLLRAAGKEFFIKQLEGMSSTDLKLFNFTEEYIYESPHAPKTAPTHHKYFSISKRRETYSGTETIEFIQSQQEGVQRLLAQKIVEFIKRTRIHDWHRGNLLLSKEIKDRWCFEIIDTEPMGILIDHNDTEANLLDTREHALLGLICFRDWYCRVNGLTILADEINKAIVNYKEENEDIELLEKGVWKVPAPMTFLQMTQTTAMIVGSIFLPILPLFLLIAAIFQECCCSAKKGTA